MFKKMMLLASLALAALAFAVPASASASGHFTDNHGPVTGSVTASFSGPATFVVPNVASYECIVHATVTVETAGGTIKSFEPTKNTCVGGGALTNCELTSATATGELTPTATDIDIKNFTLLNTFASPCPIPVVHATGELTAIPDNTTTISELTVEGSLAITGGGTMEVHAELSTETPTIGIS
jgi:hypothetical protein